MNTLSTLLACGNRKLPKTTAIFNLGTSKNCPSKRLGLCKALAFGVRCYADKAETQYPAVIPYRSKQSVYWQGSTAKSFCEDFIDLNNRKRNKFTHLRLCEAGDFYSQHCVNKADKIAKLLAKENVVVYCYTSRSDLRYDNVKHLIINGSGFKKKGITNEFKIIETKRDLLKGYMLCCGDCGICNRCATRNNNTCVVRH